MQLQMFLEVVKIPMRAVYLVVEVSESRTQTEIRVMKNLRTLVRRQGQHGERKSDD